MKNCKECTHPGRDCIPYIMTLSQEDTLAWCQARKKALHLSNDEIAERAKVPKSTVDRVFSPKATDCRFSTMQPIVCLLAGCSAEELDCDNAEHSTETLMEQIRAKDEIIRHLEEENHRKNGVIHDGQGRYRARQGRRKRKHRLYEEKGKGISPADLRIIYCACRHRFNHCGRAGAGYARPVKGLFLAARLVWRQVRIDSVNARKEKWRNKGREKKA